MKQNFLIATSLFALACFSSCKKDETGSGNGTSTDSLSISLSVDTVEMNEFDYVTVTVRDKSGADVTSQCTIFENGITPVSAEYVPTRLGNVNLYAQRGSQPSDIKSLTVVEKGPSAFTQKPIIEDLTGTWCGYCTRVMYKLEQYTATNDDLVVVAVHGSGNDPFKFQYYPQLQNLVGSTGFPTVILNRKVKWNENNAALVSAGNVWSPLGLSINSTINGSTISGTVKVKFNVNTKKQLKLVVALLENGKIHPQTNYYTNLYGGADPIVDFEHNHILRKTATDLFGDVIPADAQTKNNVYEFPFSMTNTGSTYGGGSYTANLANCEIVAFVVDGTDATRGTLNAQKAKAGVSQDFD
jgi:hypothetical protein